MSSSSFDSNEEKAEDNYVSSPAFDRYQAENFLPVEPTNVWEQAAAFLIQVNAAPNGSRVKAYVQTVSLLRIVVPSLGLAAAAKLAYPSVCLFLAQDIIHNDAGVFAVVAQDASQYIQNILTTSGLVFALIVGQTFYFMYQQQEAIYLALFEEVTMAKSLLEQVALVCQGRNALYQQILSCLDAYVQDDLRRFNDFEPAELIAAKPMDDPLEDVLYLTSVGEPSLVYQTVKSLRQARAYRLGALQRKLPDVHMTLLWVLFGIVLFTFPLLGAGSQTIGGLGILIVQSWYLSFIVLGMALTLGVIYELRQPNRIGAYNAQMVLNVMVAGLQQDLTYRLEHPTSATQQTMMMMREDEEEWMDEGRFDPSIDADGYFPREELNRDDIEYF